MSYTYKHPHAAITTDCVIFGFDGEKINVLLVERGVEPYKGQWAFPGGFLRMDETLEECAIRELQEETGFEVTFFEELKSFSAVDRDPRERVVTVAFYALVKVKDVAGGDDASSARWFPIDNIPSLAFDHEIILHEAKKRLKMKIHFEPVGFKLLPPVFKMSQLQNLYESILEVKFDRRNFNKKIQSLGILTKVDDGMVHSSSRIPFHYSFNEEKYQEFRNSGFRLEF